MTSEENDRSVETAVNDPDTAPETSANQSAPKQEGRGELIKFGILVLVFVGIIVVVAVASPIIFDRVLPGILDTSQPPTPAVGVGGEAETPAPDQGDADVFLPALTTDDGGDEAAPSDAGIEVDVEAGDDVEVEVEGEPVPVTVEPQPEPEPVTHVVQPGDNLTKIAQQYNVPVQTLMEANGLLNPNYIQVGQTLVIPTTP